jgi:hypothetical protein
MSAAPYWLVPGGVVRFMPTVLPGAGHDLFDVRFEPTDARDGLARTIVWARPLCDALEAARAWRDARKEAAQRFRVIDGGKPDWARYLRRDEF